MSFYDFKIHLLRLKNINIKKCLCIYSQKEIFLYDIEYNNHPHVGIWLKYPKDKVIMISYIRYENFF